jgi:hypothetical protein
LKPYRSSAEFCRSAVVETYKPDKSGDAYEVLVIPLAALVADSSCSETRVSAYFRVPSELLDADLSRYVGLLRQELAAWKAEPSVDQSDADMKRVTLEMLRAVQIRTADGVIVYEFEPPSQGLSRVAFFVPRDKDGGMSRHASWIFY